MITLNQLVEKLDTLLTNPKASKGLWALSGDDKRLLVGKFRQSITEALEATKVGKIRKTFGCPCSAYKDEICPCFNSSMEKQSDLINKFLL